VPGVLGQSFVRCGERGLEVRELGGCALELDSYAAGYFITLAPLFFGALTPGGCVAQPLLCDRDLAT
jgi:hypothetical protein